jgi:hypothetical protein
MAWICEFAWPLLYVGLILTPFVLGEWLGFFRPPRHARFAIVTYHVSKIAEGVYCLSFAQADDDNNSSPKMFVRYVSLPSSHPGDGGHGSMADNEASKQAVADYLEVQRHATDGGTVFLATYGDAPSASRLLKSILRAHLVFDPRHYQCVDVHKLEMRWRPAAESAGAADTDAAEAVEPPPSLSDQLARYGVSGSEAPRVVLIQRLLDAMFQKHGIPKTKDAMIRALVPVAHAKSI